MQYPLLLAAAALAHAHENHHGRFHALKRDVVTEVEHNVVTITQYVTAGVAAPTTTVEAAADEQAKWRGNGYYHPSFWSAESSSEEEETSTTSPSVYSAPSSPEVSSVEVSSVEPTSSTEPSFSAEPSSSAEVSPVEPASTTEISSAPAPSSTKPSTTFLTTSTPTSTAAAPPAYTSTAPSDSSSSTGITTTNLTPNGKKAGLSGYIGIQSKQAFTDLAPYISWYSDYAPDTPSSQGVQGIPMLWGASGSACTSVVPERLSLFNTVIDATNLPEIMFGFYEPDCNCDMSSEMSVASAQTQWDALIAPLAAQGVVLGSPSMCKQKDEDFLTPFKDGGKRDWDVTSIHINKPDLAGVKEDVEYYVQTYGKPVWVSEFACVHDAGGWSPCTEQSQIDTFIRETVSYLEGNENVVAYGPSVSCLSLSLSPSNAFLLQSQPIYSSFFFFFYLLCLGRHCILYTEPFPADEKRQNGAGLGDVWPLTSNGELTASGKAYLNAIKNL